MRKVIGGAVIWMKGKSNPMRCKNCRKDCDELYECDCAEYSEFCAICWHKVPTRHREDVCFVDWIDYELDRDDKEKVKG